MFTISNLPATPFVDSNAFRAVETSIPIAIEVAIAARTLYMLNIPFICKLTLYSLFSAFSVNSAPLSEKSIFFAVISALFLIPYVIVLTSSGTTSANLFAYSSSLLITAKQPSFKFLNSIDFASKYGIEYVILDEGWAVNGKADLFDVVPAIDIKELCDYAASKNVSIVLWAGYWAFDKDMEKICSYYADLGVKGWKIDFMDRDDQMMVDFYRRAAEMAAKYHQFVDFHGGFKPCGLNRTYPNVLNYEGVHGLEQMKWSKVGTDQLTYDVTFPYIRMACGPVDYTQGAMRNYNYRWYKPCYVDPVSQGTRCHQLGMYVIFESPFNMLCDSPQHYEQEQECTEFIAKIPTVWEETVAIDGKVGEYIVMARRHGDKWYVGGLTGQAARTVTISLDFLGEGDWKVELFKDGTNATRHAEDYVRTESPAGQSLTVEMAPGGGFAAIITR